MTYEKLATTVIESTVDDWLLTSGMGRLLNKKDLRISLVKADDRELGLPAADDRLKNAFESTIGDEVAYRLYYDGILVEPLRFVPLSEKKLLVPLPYYYSLSRFGGVTVTALERAVGLVLNPTTSKADYYGFLEVNHMYVDDNERNAHNKEWLVK